MKHPLREYARDQECLVAIPGICNFNRETTILAHPNFRSVFMCGMGQKPPDWAGAHSCSSCHDVIDGRVTQEDYTDDEIEIMFCMGIFKTLKKVIEQSEIPLDFSQE